MDIGAHTQYKDLNNTTNGKGSDATIFWDPNGKQKLTTADGESTEVEPFIALGHETIHAVHGQYGTGNLSFLPNVLDPDEPDGNIGKFSSEEIQTRKEENFLRQEHGIINRATPIVLNRKELQELIKAMDKSIKKE